MNDRAWKLFKAVVSVGQSRGGEPIDPWVKYAVDSAVASLLRRPGFLLVCSPPTVSLLSHSAHGGLGSWQPVGKTLVVTWWLGKGASSAAAGTMGG